jgi:NAD-dependent dihydropyrimidine dehydrogenase PreA subunit
MGVREIISIDEELCDGCGLCVPACQEGAIQIIDGKAKLVGENLCDGLGACLGECPQGALKIEKREADDFDESAVEAHLRRSVTKEGTRDAGPQKKECEASKNVKSYSGCPSSAVRSLKHTGDTANTAKATRTDTASEPQPAKLQSRLGHWPVQLMLVPAQAPFLDNADLLIAADCVPYAYANFHEDFLEDKAIVVGCPKLDDLEHYAGKLQEMFEKNEIRSVTVALMEVPCCKGIVAATKQALERSRKSIPLELVVIGIRGDILDKVKIAA